MKICCCLALLVVASMATRPVEAADQPPRRQGHAVKPRQKATGPEVCYVIEGELTVQVEAQQPKVFRAGKTFQLPADVVHVTTAGPTGAKVVAAWVHTPGKPFNIPAPD